MRESLKRDKGQRAKNGTFHKPMLDPTKMVTVYRTGQQITADDLLRIEHMERAKHDAEQELDRQAFLATIPGLRALHDETQKVAKANYYETATGGGSIGTRSSAASSTVTVERFIPATFHEPVFQPAVFVPSAASRATLADDGYEYKIMPNGAYTKVPKLNCDTLTVCLREAQVGVAAKVYTSPELEHLHREYDEAVKRYNEDSRDQNTHAKNMADTFFDGLSYQSRQAMGLIVHGGMRQLELWRETSNYLDLINAFLDSHEGQGYWDAMTNEEKEAFRRNQEDFLSKAKLAQFANETVINYVSRMTRRYELSLQLKELLIDNWSHDDSLWIRMLVQGVNGKNPTLKLYNECLQGLHPLLVDKQAYQPTFKLQGEHLVKLSGENSTQSKSKVEQSKKKKPKQAPVPTTEATVMATQPYGKGKGKGKRDRQGNDKDKEPARGNPITHSVDYSKFSESQLDAIVRSNPKYFDTNKRTSEDKTDKKRKPNSSKKPLTGNKKQKFDKGKGKFGKKQSALVSTNDTDEDQDDSSSESSSNEDDEEENGYSSYVTIAITPDRDRDGTDFGLHCTLEAREAAKYGAELTQRFCKGACCERRHRENVFYSRQARRDPVFVIFQLTCTML